MTVVVAVLAVVLAVALLFIVALLRSHAEILRRLAAIEAALDAEQPLAAGRRQGQGHGSASPGSARVAGDAGDSLALPTGGAATEIDGQTLAGEPISVRFGPRTPPTLLAFMGTGCQACAPLWHELHGDPVPTPAGARLIVVTKGPERERLARLMELAPSETELVMSTQAWSDFSVSATPHFVLVRGDEIAGRGSATSWAQITAFLTDAEDDDRIYRARALGTDAPAGGALEGDAPAGRALGTDARAARAERALADAGIGPDHPSLYPSREKPRD